MGVLFNTVSICQFMVVGDQPAKDLYEWASDRLSKSSFNSIDNEGIGDGSIYYLDIEERER